MINQDKWINSLPIKKTAFNEKTSQVDSYRWVNTISKNTISKKRTYNVIKKYSAMTIVFICGLLFVSVVKNETRNLEKEIKNLRTSNNIIKSNLNQAILDHEVITSPENISKLAKEYLSTNFVTYKRRQIKKLGKDADYITGQNEKNKKFSESVKLIVTKKIKKKKKELKKLQELYSKPEKIPDEIKTQVAKKIEAKKTEIKKLYTSPKETITFGKIQKWAAVQVVKVVLGMPIIPGR